MKVIANDSEFEVHSGCSLPEFLESAGYQIGLVVVERNRQALSPSEASDTILKEGDRLEIVKIVAGG